MSYKTLLSDFCKASNLNEKLRLYIKARKVWITGKSFLEPLILASTNPQYDTRLFIELKSTQYKKLVPNAFRFTYQNLKSYKPHEKTKQKTSKY